MLIVHLEWINCSWELAPKCSTRMRAVLWGSLVCVWFIRRGKLHMNVGGHIPKTDFMRQCFSCSDLFLLILQQVVVKVLVFSQQTKGSPFLMLHKHLQFKSWQECNQIQRQLWASACWPYVQTGAGWWTLEQAHLCATALTQSPEMDWSKPSRAESKPFCLVTAHLRTKEKLLCFNDVSRMLLIACKQSCICPVNLDANVLSI